MSDATEPIGENELVYRRAPVSQRWYDPKIDPKLSPMAFRPREEDIDGLSLSRAGYQSIEKFGAERNGRRYYVAVLRAGDLTSQGITVIPNPTRDDPGHVLIPRMTYATRKEKWSLEWQSILATSLTRSVEGPFPPA